MKSTSSIINLVKLIIFPYFRKHLLKVMLSIFGVALGVAVFIAIRSASFSAQQTMKNFIMSISINADLQITYGRDGFDESYYKRIKQVKGVKKISPFITKKTRMRKGNRYTSVLVIGLDITKENYSHKNSQSNMDVGKFISLPNQIIVSETFLKEHDLTKDSTVYIITAKGEVAFQIAGIMKSGSSLLSKHSELIIIDFFSAQYHFEKKNLIERLDIEIDKSFTVKEVKANLNRELGNALIIKTMNESSNQSDKLYKSFSLNLTVVSLISLLVGMYLIFNTINTSILHQRKEIGILRALGVTKKNVLIVFSLEGVIIGIIGSTIGIFLGWLLAHVSVEIFTQSLTKYYLITNVKTAYITPLYILFGFLIGVGMTLVSSFFPALAAIKIAPIDTIRSTSYDNIKKLKLNYFTITGFVILVIALFTSQIKPIFDIPFFGFLSNLLIILGLSFMAPSIITIIIKLIRPLFLKIFKRGMTLSGDNITRSLGRNSITISTLMICIALVVSIITLIQSYHYSIGKWFNQVNNADFSIVSGSSYADGDIFPMDENRIDSIIKNPKTKAMIKDIDFYRFYTTSYNGDLIDILSFKVNVAKNHVRFTFIPNENQDSVFETMINDDAILISENMASKHKIKKGDFIKLMTKSGKKDFKVAGIIVNYLSSKGIVSISRQLFIKHWNDKLVDAFKIYLQNNVRVKEFREFVYKTIDKPENLIFKTLKEFKTDVINAINETFIMFHALEFITVLIAILGIINALLASILERKREIGILRSIGATKSQISVMILTEAGLIGIIGAIIGVIGGILLSLVTVFVINKQTVGWYLEYDLPITILIYILIGSFILSTISGYYPSRKAANIIIHNALEYE